MRPDSVNNAYKNDPQEWGPAFNRSRQLEILTDLYSGAMLSTIRKIARVPGDCLTNPPGAQAKA
jgi:hypothetical protein